MDVEAPPGARPAGGGTRLRHEPALDGLRGVAVALVVCFHAGVRGFGGGYVGVSVFFTLSGFLITRLLLAEHHDHGRIDVGAFYARRARRLLPASAACLLAISIGAMLGAWSLVDDLRQQLVGAALWVFNWVRLAGSGSYADLFAVDGGQPSPLEHYWSLAIEEQFYWVWPLVAATALRWRSRPRAGHGRTTRDGSAPRSLLAPTAAVTALAIAAGPATARWWGPDAAYWATPARVGEILTGALAAVVLVERGSPRVAKRLAPIAALGIAVATVAFPVGRGPAYDGWLPALSLVTAVLLLGLQHDGPLRRALSFRPLVALGAVSYGVYLFHWPLFTLLDAGRVRADGWRLLAVRLGATAAVAVGSYLLLEQPVRRSGLRTRPTLALGGASVAAVVVVALLAPTTGVVVDTAGEAGTAAAIDRGGPTTPLEVEQVEPAIPTAGQDPEEIWRALDLEPPTPDRPVRIVVFGDSTAKATGGGLARWAAAHPDLAQVTVDGAAGCGFVRGGVRVFPEREQEVPVSCGTYVDEDLARATAELRPDVVLFLTGGWDIVDQRFPGTEALAPTDDEYRQRIRDGFADATANVLDAGAPKVVWLAEPTSDPYWNPVVSPQEDPARHEVLHQAMRELAAADPARVAVADLGWWLTESGMASDHAARPDGVHLTAEAAEEVSTRWLGPVALGAALSAS